MSPCQRVLNQGWSLGFFCGHLRSWRGPGCGTHLLPKGPLTSFLAPSRGCPQVRAGWVETVMEGSEEVPRTTLKLEGFRFDFWEEYRSECPA